MTLDKLKMAGAVGHANLDWAALDPDPACVQGDPAFKKRFVRG